MVTEVPTWPEVCGCVVILGVHSFPTRRSSDLRPATVISTLPVAAPLGTGATMLMALQLVGVAARSEEHTSELQSLKQIVCRLLLTEEPTGPEVGDRLVMLGGVVTVKLTALLARPATVTSTLPVAAPLRHDAIPILALQLVGVAAVPLKVTELNP